MVQDNTGMKYRKDITHKTISGEFFNNVRRRLNLTNKQLTDNQIKKVLRINGNLIADWVVTNADGFKIKDNGVILISKWLPKCLRGDREQKIEEIMNNPKNDAYMKDMFTKRYNKSLEFYKNHDPTPRKYHINLHSFFHIYRMIWFNSRNCKFDKADLYELKITDIVKEKLNHEIIQGREFFAWNFSDWRIRKRDSLTPEQLVKREAGKEKRRLERELKEQLIQKEICQTTT